MMINITIICLLGLPLDWTVLGWLGDNKCSYLFSIVTEMEKRVPHVHIRCEFNL